jgi:phage shock protein C
VCAGLADWLGIDVLAVRLALIVATLATGPVAILLYILTGWLATDDR